jgi:hypothetical protein
MVYEAVRMGDDRHNGVGNAVPNRILVRLDTPVKHPVYKVTDHCGIETAVWARSLAFHSTG